MPVAALAVWIAALAVVALVIVPLAVALLRRTLFAAWRIEAYLADMRAAGAGIAAHTGAVPALDDTIALAAAMQPVAKGIEAKSGAVAALLTGAAQGRPS
ncbi:hypothetical protein BH23PSE1_BH23PSE1_02580 [soil metagenome]